MASEPVENGLENKPQPQVDDNDLSNSDIVTKYRTASNIANLALTKVLKEVKPGVSVKHLCELGDSVILEESSKLYNKKENGRKVEKGIAFPTCVSLNEIIDNFSPTEDTVLVKEGDVVKVSLGSHIDGYVGLVSHTVFVGETITGRTADVLKAAWLSCEAALRKLKAGGSSSEVAKVVERVAAQFNCTPMVGFYSHEMKRHIIEGTKNFSLSTKLEDKMDPITFGAKEAYSVNVVLTTGEHKSKQTEHITTVYRTEVQNRYTLKTSLGRSFMSQVNSKFPVFPFHLKSFDDERALKVGLQESLRHNLLKPYYVTTGKTGDVVAHFRFTALLLPTGTKKISGLAFDQLDKCNSELKVEDPELLSILSAPVNPKKKKATKDE
ncbi:proliferation-associated protein 2g4 [Theileria orientalis strain Shintoku]|uniref:Proliferation-associated protein 2g4 n=1 Tax=Theileria orientalis strain Shintoku TaxID=869250 RepID=J4C7D8_THEOR|nr:proliferation-associated protein 2g4 [Theileria orientalis strain Shintoku]BAM38863.1 proliferation-associated protein 2g4 [Theileria orientalis strain Shintoku]|eukprot:XP_009689164.1 proliferation-associated protein 2g4 [Theileria orientalis strain Shintoku]